MGKRKVAGKSGAVTAFISRTQAMKRLQLSLKDFRRLCIMKGIYPVEPTNKKVMKSGLKSFYNAKDIRFLSHEPIIEKFRAAKTFAKKITKAKGRKETSRVEALLQNKPTYKLDHIIRERYPTFVDALRDLDDCLTMTHLFATFPMNKASRKDVVGLCRRLTVEFQHFIIQTRSLRKVFISIKGLYFQAEVKGQSVTWITPHKVCYEEPEGVDFRIMSTFVEFYTTLLGFVNFKLYNDIGVIYPPKVQGDPADFEQGDSSEYVEALNKELKSVNVPDTEETDVDAFPTADMDNPDAIDRARLEAEATEKQMHLFDGLKFFLNREVPRESLTFVIRCLGGSVSWDKTTAPSATYQSDDESITHHIIDRPPSDHQLISRYYIQPQWVFDSVNARKLLPVKNYLPGSMLPPHLSPFVEDKEGVYVPPEKLELLRGEEESEDEEQQFRFEDNDEEEGSTKKKTKRKREVLSSLDLKKKKGEESGVPNKRMTVRKGRAEVVNEEQQLKEVDNEEKKLTEMMIPNKKKRLYQRIMKTKQYQQKEVRKLQNKRKAFDAQQNKQKKRKLQS